MPADSNADALAAELDRLADAFDLTRDNLGKDVLANQVVRISDRAADETGTAGKWAENRGKYGDRKRAKGLPVGVGTKGDGAPMLSLQELAGVQEITADSAIMSPGTSDEAARKAEWFSNGSTGTDGQPSGATNQPPRPFYGITDDDADAILAEFADFAAKALEL